MGLIESLRMDHFKALKLIIALVLARSCFAVLIFSLNLEPYDSKSLCQWDCQWFKHISEQGYSLPNEQDFRRAAFFPLFPLIFGVTDYFRDLFNSNLIYVAALFLGALITNLLLFIWLQAFTSNQIPLISLILFNLSPDTIWSIIPYSETAFIIFLLGFFISLRKIQSTPLIKPFYFFAAAVFCGLLTGTKFIGVFASLTFILECFVFQKSKLKTNYKLLGTTIAFGGIIGYSVFLFYKFSNPFLFYKAQAHWQRDFIDSPIRLIDHIQSLVIGAPETFGIIILSLFFFIKNPRKIKFLRAEKLFFLCNMILPFFTSRPTGHGRLISIVPIYLPIIALYLNTLRNWSFIIWKLLIGGATIVLIHAQFWNLYDYFCGAYNHWVG